jgi:hypothetical protein
MVAIASFSSWLLAAQSQGALPRGDFTPQPGAAWTLTGPDAETLRHDALSRAAVYVPDGVTARETGPGGTGRDAEVVACRFLRAAPTGTSAKFDCVLDGGAIVKIKYSRNPEIQAEVAATRLARALGFGADRVDIVPRLRCFGCPRFPFFTTRVLSSGFADRLLGMYGYDGGYTDFEWVALERKFPAPAIETATHHGWAWWELEQSTALPADVDALRLLAVFLAHWDNKAENQRLVCLDDPAGAAGRCDRPLALVQDLGATFGPNKVNLARWREFPIWSDRAACRVSLHRLPFGGGTFPDHTISEAGRIRLGRQLAALSDGQVRRLFAEARFPEYHTGTDDDRDLQAWTRAFRFRADQIVKAGPCPT